MGVGANAHKRLGRGGLAPGGLLDDEAGGLTGWVGGFVLPPPMGRITMIMSKYARALLSLGERCSDILIP